MWSLRYRGSFLKNRGQKYDLYLFPENNRSRFNTYPCSKFAFMYVTHFVSKMSLCCYAAFINCFLYPNRLVLACRKYRGNMSLVGFKIARLCHPSMHVTQSEVCQVQLQLFSLFHLMTAMQLCNNKIRATGLQSQFTMYSKSPFRWEWL